MKSKDIVARYRAESKESGIKGTAKVLGTVKERKKDKRESYLYNKRSFPSFFSILWKMSAYLSYMVDAGEKQRDMRPHTT